MSFYSDLETITFPPLHSDYTDPSPASVNRSYPNAGHFFTDIIPETPTKKREDEGESIKSVKKPRRLIVKKPRKKEAVSDDEFQLRGMERFVSVMFCRDCQEKAQFNGKRLSIAMCKRCRHRAENYK